MPARSVRWATLVPCLLAVFLLAAVPAAAQSVLDGFDPGANGRVRVLAVQADGQVLVGGDFTELGGQPRGGIGRLYPDGSLDPGFNPDANGEVSSLALQPDGKVLVGGLFTELGGQSRDRIARLNPDGSLDAGFNPGANNKVANLVLQPDGKVLVGGTFTQIDGQPRTGIARLNPDGSLDTGFDPGADNSVFAVTLQPDGKVLLGGLFAEIGGQPRERIARLNPNGSLDTGFDPGADNGVLSLILQPDGKVLVGGEFTVLGGQPRNHLARLNPDGSLDAGFDPGANGTVYSLALQPDGKVLVGGDFSELGGQPRDHLARLNLDGALDAGFNPGANHWVNSLAVQPDGKVLVGGVFTEIGSQPRNYLGRLYADGSVDADFNPGANGWVNSLAVQPDGKVLVGGYFNRLGGQPREHIARLNPDGSLDADFNPDARSVVLNLVLQPDGKILAGGAFTQIGGQPRNYTARLHPDGSLDEGFNPGANNLVNSLVMQPDGKVLAGGEFTELGGQPRNRIARLNPDGSLDADFNPDANGSVNSLALQPDGKVLVGGGFVRIDGQPRYRLARLNPDGSLDADFNPSANSWVDSMALQPDGKVLVGGFFTQIDGQPRNHLARLNPDGSLDADFNPGANSWVYSMALQPDGKVLVGGGFGVIDGQPRNYLARLNPDGSVDASFNTGADDWVMSMTLQPDGKVLVGGQLTQLGGEPRNRLGRLSLPEAALQELVVSADRSSLSWQRSGAGPELERVWFEQSADAVEYVALGEAMRVPGGWSLALAEPLPQNQDLWLRARGNSRSGAFNSSGSLHESVLWFHERNVHQITVNTTGNGTATPPMQTINDGGDATFTLTPDTGHHAASVTGDTCTPVDNGDGTWTAASITADCTIDVVFAINQYTVTFVDWDASVLSTQTVDHGDAAIAPADPTRPGYGFTGWDVPFDNITGDLTVIAQYTINQYTVTFVDWDATVLDVQSIDHGEAAVAPADPTRPGYGFTGWDVPFDTITSDLTVTAQNAINQYTVTFVDWDATVLSTQTVDHGDAAVAPADPTRPGYGFTGWDGPFGNVTSDLTVTAQYDINQYTVTFVDWDAAMLSTQTVDHGDAAVAPADPTRPGYGFTGWDVPFDTITSDLTVTAQYAINQYTVTFVDWDAAVLDVQSIDHGEAAIAPADPTRPGYGFTGWEVPFDNITSDLTVTAQYDINQYTVTFVDWDATVLSTQTVDHGDAAVAPADPTRPGYGFTGWDAPFDNITSDLTITAQYAINQYTVTFVDWDASVLSTQTVDHGEAAGAPADPVRPGHAFTGWDVPFDNITSDLTVTAQYDINQYTVTATVSGSHGTIAPLSQTVDHGDDAHFTVTPDSGFHGLLVGDTCNPTDNGDGTWTAANITVDCQVTASFAQNLADAVQIHAGDGQITPVLGSFAQALSVRVVDAADAPLAGITVNFSTPGSGASAMLSAASVITDTDGVASITATANGIAGSYPVQAQVGGVATPARFDLENTALTASVSLSMSPTSPAPGSTVRFTVTVTGEGPLVPGGTVDVLVDGVVVCAAIALSNGSATCQAGPFANAPHQAWASYPGDEAHAPADSSAIGFEVHVPMPVPVNNPWVLAWLVALFALIGMPLARRRRGTQ